MYAKKQRTRDPEKTRQRLVEAGLGLMLRQGFNATSVDQVCAEAGLTKGSFFHHFESKESLGGAVVDFFADYGTTLYSAAWKDPALDPLDQIHELFNIMTGFTQLPDQACVCMVGMMAQETAAENPAMRERCAGHLTTWTVMMKDRLAAAKKRYPVRTDFDPEHVAWFLNSLWQGSMLIAKTRQDQTMIADNIRIARDYVDHLFELKRAVKTKRGAHAL